MTIHNPWGLKLSEKDISQGWRFCCVQELMVARPEDAMFKVYGDPAWSKSRKPGFPCTLENLAACTYITRLPLPYLQNMKGVKISPATPPPATPAEADELDVLTKFLGDS